MGGRGRGRGKMSFTMEQLGLSRGEVMPAPLLQPPPHYPLLEYYPAAMLVQQPHMAQLTHKTGFLKHFSRYKLCLTPKAPSTICSADEHMDNASDVRLNFDWTRFPFELRPNTTKRKKTAVDFHVVKEKIPRMKNINALLDELEKKEVTIKKEVEGEEGEGEEKECEEEEMEEDIDEEMDEGTDYNQNYFDNGENYLDEDDDGDDGPIY